MAEPARARTLKRRSGLPPRYLFDANYFRAMYQLAASELHVAVDDREKLPRLAEQYAARTRELEATTTDAARKEAAEALGLAYAALALAENEADRMRDATVRADEHAEQLVNE